VGKSDANVDSKKAAPEVVHYAIMPIITSTLQFWISMILSQRGIGNSCYFEDLAGIDIIAFSTLL
jgi:hypothetical protein